MYMYNILHGISWIIFFFLQSDKRKLPRFPSVCHHFPSPLEFICSRGGQWLCRCPHRCSWSNTGRQRSRWTGGRGLYWLSWSLRHRERSLLKPVRCPCKDNQASWNKMSPLSEDTTPIWLRFSRMKKHNWAWLATDQPRHNQTRAAANCHTHSRLRLQHKFVYAKIDAATSCIVVMLTC